MVKKTWFWCSLFAALFLLGGGSFLLLRGLAGGGHVAAVYLDGECIRRIDLDAVVLPYEFDVESEWGYNVIRVERGGIAVVEADCPDQICVHQGTIDNGAVPIVCMPHRLVIQIEGAEY
jgi:hypothetical protein